MFLVNTDWQSQYGQGTRGAKPSSEDEALATVDQAWGPSLDGAQTISWDGTNQAYSQAADAVKCVSITRGLQVRTA